jgi:hypothetical protein
MSETGPFPEVGRRNRRVRFTSKNGPRQARPVRSLWGDRVSSPSGYKSQTVAISVSNQEWNGGVS